ncbi:DUF6282 family protein [Stenotrophomonas tumulicola]|uniref:Amidohydrolase-related domain-containing protein n=1 Tax=Stenotrophomonas tumulicola TaxID=1685415 RepID=A0A7W3FME1_9GAMM|nr:DUF6282 family protein [Stenotrophomonas tumulicola]MBA8682241.1 hypothetical protein [Stenotrophomonas tumulicola]
MNSVVERPTPPVSNEQVEDILKGCIDLHCHSGPSVMPRYCDHIEVMHEASEAGMKALLLKDHYYSCTPIAQLLNKHYDGLGVRILSGVPLNNASGGLNIHAVEHGLKLGANLVWMPTFSSANHIAHHKKDASFTDKFPQTTQKMLQPIPLTVLDDDGKLKEEVKGILDVIAEAGVVLSAGHLHISEIWPLFEEARKRGVKRLLVNHPTYVIDATLDDMRQLAREGVFMEHSMCMWTPGSKFKFWDADEMRDVIEAGTTDLTILGSDLGQVGNPNVTDGFRYVIRMVLELGYSEADVRKMTSHNAARLMGI